MQIYCKCFFDMWMTIKHLLLDLCSIPLTAIYLLQIPTNENSAGLEQEEDSYLADNFLLMPKY